MDYYPYKQEWGEWASSQLYKVCSYAHNYDIQSKVVPVSRVTHDFSAFLLCMKKPTSKTSSHVAISRAIKIFLTPVCTYVLLAIFAGGVPVRLSSPNLTLFRSKYSFSGVASKIHAYFQTWARFTRPLPKLRYILSQLY